MTLPLEERRSRAVTLRRALPENSQDLGSLDVEAIDAAANDAWPTIRNADELHDALLTLGLMNAQDIQTPRGDATDEMLSGWFEELMKQGRVSTVIREGQDNAWDRHRIRRHDHLGVFSMPGWIRSRLDGSSMVLKRSKRTRC